MPAPPSSPTWKTTGRRLVAATALAIGGLAPARAWCDPPAPDPCAELRAQNASRTDAAFLIELGECHAKRGRTASAWALMREAANAARAEQATATETDAKSRAAALEARLARLTVVAPADPNLVVSRNGTVLPPELRSVALPVDPGPQVIEAHAKNKQPWKTTVIVPAEPTSLSVEVPPLEPAVSASPVVPPPSGAPPEPPVESGSSGSGQRVLAVALGGIGLVGVGVGTVFGIRTITLWDDAKSTCPGGGTQCTREGIAQADEASRSGTISTIAFVAGGVGLVAGVLVWVTAPSASKAPASAAPSRGLAMGLGSVGYKGVF